MENEIERIPGFSFVKPKMIVYKTGRGHGRRQNLYQKQAFELLGKKCQACGTTKKRIITHHIDGNYRNDDPTNWMRLCDSCHILLHALGYIPADKEKYRREKKAEMKRKAIETSKAKCLENRKKKIPYGYITTSEAMKILGVSRERMRQIRKDFNYKWVILGKGHRGQPYWRKIDVLKKSKAKEELKLFKKRNHDSRPLRRYNGN